MATFARNCSVKMTFRLFGPLSAVMTKIKAAEEVQKIATDQKEYRKCSFYVVIS